MTNSRTTCAYPFILLPDLQPWLVWTVAWLVQGGCCRPSEYLKQLTSCTMLHGYLLSEDFQKREIGYIHVKAGKFTLPLLLVLMCTDHESAYQRKSQYWLKNSSDWNTNNSVMRKRQCKGGEDGMWRAARRGKRGDIIFKKDYPWGAFTPVASYQLPNPKDLWSRISP